MQNIILNNGNYVGHAGALLPLRSVKVKASKLARDLIGPKVPATVYLTPSNTDGCIRAGESETARRGSLWYRRTGDKFHRYLGAIYPTTDGLFSVYVITRRRPVTVKTASAAMRKAAEVLAIHGHEAAEFFAAS